MHMNRRRFLQSTTLSAASLLSVPGISLTSGGKPVTATVLNPLDRVPISMIIDDSTALVNMAHFGIPQFAEVFPENYQQDWKKLPREIPDSFVLEFVEWCDQHGVKGKYSMVPYPACTGWLHRFIPGWSKQELEASLRLVREAVTPNWDIHPEMISHTRVIDIRTGLPYPEASPDYMENWEWSQDKSADELGAYLAYALNILKEAGFRCEGITTPGGFGHRNMDNLARGTLEAVREVYGGATPHFFRNVITDPAKSVAPQIFHPAGLDSDDPHCAVHIIGCTGDWFGGWDGLTPGDVDRFITADGTTGRLVEVIEQDEPAIMVCHWPGIYYNGEKLGFNIFKEVVRRVEQKYPDVLWMKNSEIARYWAAKELTRIKATPSGIQLEAPFPAIQFTVKIQGVRMEKPVLSQPGEQMPLKRVDSRDALQSGAWWQGEEEVVLCIDLPKGTSMVG